MEDLTKAGFVSGQMGGVSFCSGDGFECVFSAMSLKAVC